MNQFLFHRNLSPSCHLCICLLLPILLTVLSSCSNQSKQIKKPGFELVEARFAKGVDKIENRFVLIVPTNTFTTKDNFAISYVKFANLSGEHKVKWEWYKPDGNLYYASEEYTFKIAKDRYAEEASTYHKLSIAGDKAQELIGKWKVNIYYDGDLITTRGFEIMPDVLDISLDVDKNIPDTSMYNPEGIAVVIGNRKYHHPDVPDVEYAHNDAFVIRQYLTTTLGYKESNIIFETDITKSRFEVLFGIDGNHKGKLFNYIRPGKSDVFVYYSGHGAPDVNTRKGYFVPVDSDPNNIAFNGYSLDLFYDNLSKLDAKRMTIVLDSCFSGGTNTGEWIISKASPALIKVNNPITSKQDAIVLSSSESDQISSWYQDKKHGLFTYFFLKAISGSADINGDNQITYKEIYDYISDKSEGVPYWAKRLHSGRIQTPTIDGVNTNDVIVVLK